MSEKTPSTPEPGPESISPGIAKLVITIDGDDEGKPIPDHEVARPRPIVPEFARPRPIAPEVARSSPISSVASLGPDIERLVQQAVRAAPPAYSPAPPEPPPNEIEAAALNLCDAMAGNVFGWTGGDGERRIVLKVAMGGPGVESSPFNKKLMAAYHHAVCWMVRANLVTVDVGLPPKEVAGTIIPKNEGLVGRVTSLRASQELWNRRQAGSIFGRSTGLFSHLFRLLDIGDALALMPHRWKEITSLYPNGYDAALREHPEVWHAVFGGIGVAAGTSGATGPDTLLTVPAGLIQRACSELHGDTEANVNIREMGSWLERWGRAFHPFAPVGWLIAEQAALPIEWWLHRRRMLEVLARLAVIVPEELTARPALSGAWSRRELVTHRELMSWLSCSRPVVQFSTLSMAAGSTTFAAMAVEGNLAGTEGGEGKPDSKKVDVLGRRRALRDVVPKLEPIAAEYFAQSEPLRQALNKVMRPGEQKWETFLFDAAAHFSARDSDGRVVPDRHYHHSAHTPPQIARYVLGQMIEAAANGNWAMVKELRNRLRDDEPDADAIAQTEFGGLAEVLLYLCRLEQRPELVNKINRVMEEAGVTLGNDTLGEIQRAGIAHSIMIKRVLAIWANTDPIMFVCRTPDGMLVTPEWVVEPTKEQDTKRENLSDAESAPAKEANAKRGGPPKTTVETDSCTHGLLLLADAQRKSEKPSVTQLADTMGVTRQSLYENKDFAPVRDMANKLFGLFGKEAKRGEWQGPRGSKSKDGTVEAVDSADDSDN